MTRRHLPAASCDASALTGSARSRSIGASRRESSVSTALGGSRTPGALGGVSNAVLDGEVVCLDHEGRPVFSALHRRGVDLFAQVVQRDLEGVVAKLKQAPY